MKNMSSNSFDFYDRSHNNKPMQESDFPCVGDGFI